MALQHSPRIVTDGLVLCLDAANPKSYSGSGVTWGDLSNTGNNGTITNVTYSTLNGGNMAFNGTSSRVDCGAASQVGSSLTALTVEVMMRTAVAETKLIAENGTSFTQNTFYLAQENSTQFTFSTYGGGGQDLIAANFSYQTNQWYHLVGVWQSGVRNKIYSNGVDVTSPFIGSIRTTLQNGNTNLFLGCRGGAGSFFFNGDIPVFRVYTTALSPQQVVQNFNSLRGRFGL